MGFFDCWGFGVGGDGKHGVSPYPPKQADLYSLLKPLSYITITLRVRVFLEK